MIVKIIDWQLINDGYALARRIDNDTVEVIETLLKYFRMLMLMKMIIMTIIEQFLFLIGKNEETII